MSPVAACTIASNNYLAFARVLAESYRRHHPGAEVYVCIVDTPHPAIAYDELPFVPIFAHDLEIPCFHNLAFRYGVLELNTAVKPYLLTYLRDHFDLDRVFYFDPDILVCDRLAGLALALDHHQAVLTPHITQPLDDQHHPSERMLVQCGVYNLGFLGMRLDPRTAGFLDWWQRRLHRLCLVDLPSGLFVDQSWMALAPAFLDSVAVVRDPVYNIAYWNLPHRPVTVEADGWRVDGRRVGFFHFSGVDLEDLEVVSRHQDRLSLDRRPELRPCFEHYRDRVLAAGHGELRDLPYGYDRFTDSGVEIPPEARRILQRVDPAGRRWPNPFADRDDDSFFRWLTEPLEFERGRLNRLALTMWEEREEVTTTFPEVTGEDLWDFVRWLEEAAAEGLIEPLFAAGAAKKPRPTHLERFAGTLLPDESAAADDDDLISGLVHTLIPLDPSAELCAWLNQPVPGSGRRRPVITRLAMALHGLRPDAQAAYPDPLGVHQLDVALWFVIHARQTFQLPPAVIEPVASTLPAEIRKQVEGAWGEKRARLLGALLASGPTTALASWLNQPAGGSGGEGPAITRLAMVLYELRRDLQAALPDPLGGDRGALARWFVDEARERYRLPQAFVEPVERGLAAEPRAAAAGRRISEGMDVLRRLLARDQPPGLCAWLNETAPGGGGEGPRVTRLAEMLHGARGDLQAALPDPRGGHRRDLARGFVDQAREAYRLPPEVVTPVEESLAVETAGSAAPAVPSVEPAEPRDAEAASRPRPTFTRGVNLAGHYWAATGVGQMSRASAAVLEHAGIPFVRLPLDQQPVERTFRRAVHPPEGLPYPVTLLNSNADHTPTALESLPLVAAVKNYKIGYWYWELAHFPLTFADRFDLLDEVWAASRFGRRAFEAISTLPVRCVPPYVPPPRPMPRDRARYGLDEDRFVFFYAFDAGSIPERKNPWGAIEAIRRFRLASSTPVGLLLKVYRGSLDPDLMPRLRRLAEGLPVTFFTGKASRDDMDGMLASSDAVLSLHRSEGLGLLPIEGLYLEKPVVATAYGGVTDYLDATTGYPVDYRLEALDRDHLPYPRGSVWADPKIDHAVEQMRKVVENPAAARRVAAEGRRRVEEIYGLEAAAERFAGELERVFDSLDA